MEPTYLSSTSTTTSTGPLPTSFHQAEITARIKCYQEKVLRAATVTYPNWERALGWTDADEQPYKDAHEDSSVSDKLGYKMPRAISCEDVEHYKFLPASDDDTGLQGVLRCEVARRRPELQFDIFGWTTPKTKNPLSWQAFEAVKATYWEHATHENRMEMHTFQDTADFHANALLRILYLYGETPVHLQTAEAVWRPDFHFGRDVNFSSTIEAEIIDRLLMFKYWVDDPFNISDDARPGDGKNIVAERDRLAATDRKTGGPLPPSKTDPKTGLPLPTDGSPEYPGDERLQEMTFWSENHQLLFATAEYLAGQWLPDAVFRAGNPYRGEGADRTRDGDKTGRQRMKHARPRLLRWLNDRLRFGFSEWNAPGYYEEDFQPLFNLADFCLDEQIRTRAHMVIDLLIFDLARFTNGGSFGATAGRDYFEHKSTGFGQSVGDLIELLFGTRNGVVTGGNSPCAVSFASSRRYVVPDVLVEIAVDPHPRIVDRSRVSVTLDEASVFSIGVDSDEDMMFWWSRGAYFVKQVIESTHRHANQWHLLAHTPPFKDILPKIDTAAIGLDVVDGLSFIGAVLRMPGLASILMPVLGTGLSSNTESSIANALSVLTEGSALTRANLYTFRDQHSMLSSAQNWRPGQFSFQTQAVIATLGMQAMVWTGHPSAGAYISKQALEEAAEIGGGILGGLAGDAFFGPVGLIAGGVLGLMGGKSAADAITGDASRGIEIYPADTHDGPNWWTGTVTSPRVVQRQNAAIAIYRPQAFQKLLFGERTHAWFPKAAFEPGSVVQRAGNSNTDDGLWTFGKAGDGYIGLFSAGKPQWTTDGPWKDKELRIEQNGNVFIYQVGSIEQFGSFESFVDLVTRARIYVDDLDECSYDVPFGHRLELHYDDNVRWGGRPFADDNFPRFQNPYVSSGYVGWTQYHYTIAHNGDTLTHDFRELKTVEKEPKVYRQVQGKTRQDNDHFLVIAHHGSPKTSCENTIQSLHQAAQIESANALEIDLCMTKDGHIVLWHDWSPDDAVALIRQLGEQGNNRFRPNIPNILSSWRRDLNDLTLDELREHYGYEEIEGRLYVGEINPVDTRIPTLVEFIQAASGWDNLEHVFLDVKMPDSAAGDAAKMMDAVIAALQIPHHFAVTALVPHEKVLAGMKKRAASVGSDLAFSWDREFPAGVVLHASDYSAIDGAIQYGNTVASVGRPTSVTLRPWHVYQKVMEYDTDKWVRFNVNPQINKGHQIDKLIAWTIDDRDELDWLLRQGVSGVITDDVPMLRDAAIFNQLPL